MTSRERVWRTVHRLPVDRLPLDLGGMKASGINASAYHRVKRRIGMATPTRVSDARFMIAEVEDDFRRRFHLDVTPLDWSMAFNSQRPEADWVPRTMFDGTPVLLPPETRIGEDAEGNWLLLDAAGRPTSYRMPRNGHYFDDISFDDGQPIDPNAFRPVHQLPEEQVKAFASYARRLQDDGDTALLGWGFGVCFLGMSLITDRASNVTQARPSEWMMMLMTEKDTCHDMMDRAVDASISCLRQVYQAIGDACFAWGIAADDSGTQRGEFIAPDLWAEMIKPHYARLCAWIHAHTRMKTFLHCCGSIYNLIPHLIEAGVDILNPVQIAAANMDPVKLKREFGDRLIFWGGGCDTQGVLGRVPADEVRRHVRQNVSVYGRGGGYVFNQVHNIQSDVPTDNIIAMLEAAYEAAGTAAGG